MPHVKRVHLVQDIDACGQTRNHKLFCDFPGLLFAAGCHINEVDCHFLIPNIPYFQHSIIPSGVADTIPMGEIKALFSKPGFFT
jgi:hypothetical protein